jgi:hypothetical protein
VLDVGAFWDYYVEGYEEGMFVANQYPHVLFTQFDGEPDTFYPGLNAYIEEPFDLNHISLSPNEDGYADTISDLYVSLMRNAAQLNFYYTDAETGEEYYAVGGENISKTCYNQAYDAIVPFVASWYEGAIFDVSELNANRFYSVVGITNANGKNGSGSGVLFGVYGDYGDGNYVLLAQSKLITKTDSGEFDVDITGVKLLKLVVMPGGNNNASSGCAWADASIYTTEGELNLPTEPETEPTTRPTSKPSTRPTAKPTQPADGEPAADFPIGLVIGIAAAVVVAVVVVVVIIVIKKKKPEAPAE